MVILLYLGSTITNNYYLSTIGIGGINNSAVSGQAEARTEAQFKADAMITTLGTAFKKDTAGVNGGYPILDGLSYE